MDLSVVGSSAAFVDFWFPFTSCKSNDSPETGVASVVTASSFFLASASPPSPSPFMMSCPERSRPASMVVASVVAFGEDGGSLVIGLMGLRTEGLVTRPRDLVRREFRLPGLVVLGFSGRLLLTRLDLLLERLMVRLPVVVTSTAGVFFASMTTCSSVFSSFPS